MSDVTQDQSKIVFRNPNFRVHRSLLRFILPLSKFAKLPSNAGKTLSVGVILTHSDTFTTPQPPRLLLLKGTHGLCAIPSGRAIFGTDQTLLEAVARVTRETTGLVVTDIVKSIGGAEFSGGSDKGERFKRYSFFVKVSREVSAGIVLGSGYQSWQWVSRKDLESADRVSMDEGVQETVEKAFDSIETAVSPTLRQADQQLSVIE